MASPRKARTALRAGGEIIADEERRLVPVLTGKLKRSIAVDDAGGVVPKVLVGPREGEGPGEVDYADDVELGKQGRAAQPFVRPAIDTKADEALRTVGEALAKDIDEIARR